MKPKISTILLLLFFVFPFSSCMKKGEEDPFFSLRSRKARLTGEWEVTKYYVDGEDILNYSSTNQGIDYYCGAYTKTTNETLNITYEFEEDGDFDMTVSDIYSYSYDYNTGSYCNDVTNNSSDSELLSGEWEFEDKKSKLELKYKTGYLTIQEFDIIGLSNKKLILESIIDGEKIEIEMEKD